MKIYWKNTAKLADVEEYEIWLLKNVGERGDNTWRCHWLYGYIDIYDESDAAIFRLTFGV